jgi:pimeloyl-ACP methyl ester carboxylesterase
MSTVTSRDGTSLAYETAGEGPPLILVDGPLCHRSAGSSVALAGLLADRFTVVAYDRRGRGDSGDVTPYAVERELEDLDTLVQTAGGSAYAFGISTGGVLALDAAHRKTAITKIAVYEPPAPRGPLVARLIELVTAGSRAEAVDLFLTAAAGLPEETIPAQRRNPRWPALETLAHTLVYDAMVMAGPFTRWSGLNVPALVAHADDSDHDVQAAAKALADVLPRSRLHSIPGRHHQMSRTALRSLLTEFFT